ncbi:glycerol kinase GlpK [Fulvivirga sedimenti]|uniref:Glycerol kinase n=1 Tax=Fulvivirga sedimenti TaxID=2879465 RepID=A0A9X1L068_9BACT|nr:glycerol kinase GlpK [Fulvivirga sedimenti]MCA6079175.1 glycerol kinase GlpK [Fulvivirga sedimenti]
MKSGKYIIALDQGTTSSRAVLFDALANVVAIEQQEFSQIYPKAGWVEHDANEIWKTQLKVFEDLVAKHVENVSDIAAIGITNQRETTLIWDRNTGEPIHNALVWQDTRTSDYCERLKRKGLETKVRDSTGLVIDAYFSATKIIWLLDNVEGARERAEKGELMFGTMDSWLVYNLTGKKQHVTDMTNASRTMFYNIQDHRWDESLLKVLNIPPSLLPEVKNSAAHFGDFEYQGHMIPITGIAGDQQAALFGQQCFEAGMAKNTYGTGCFMLMNIGKEMQLSDNGLITTVGIALDGKFNYALEGSVFVAGAAVQWLRDGLKIIEKASETEQLAKDVIEAHDVVMVPAFVGLGAPYWDMYARGAVFGLTRDTNYKHLVKATLESLAYQTRDIIIAMQKDAGYELKSLKVDGGAVANNYLMQFQADILQVNVERPAVIESTAQGAAYLAGLGCGLWTLDELSAYRELDAVFEPVMKKEQADKLYRQWQKAVKRTMNWVEDD